MVEPQPSKLIMPVRSRSAALKESPVQRPVRLGQRGLSSVRKARRATNVQQRATRGLATSATNADDGGKPGPDLASAVTANYALIRALALTRVAAAVLVVIKRLRGNRSEIMHVSMTNLNRYIPPIPTLKPPWGSTAHNSLAMATPSPAAGCALACTMRNRSMLTLVYRCVVSSRVCPSISAT
jgi:hypothetical protein